MDFHRIWLIFICTYYVHSKSTTATATAAMDPQVQALQLRHRLHLLKGSAKNPMKWIMFNGKLRKTMENHGKSWKITGTSLDNHATSMEQQYQGNS